MTRLLDRPLRPAARQQLLSIAGETAAMLGWLCWDLEWTAEMQQYWQLGRQAADAAEDRALGAFIGASAAMQPSYREHPEQRLRLLEDRDRDATPRTRAWIFANRGEAYAPAGDELGCLRAFDVAETMLAQVGDDRSSRRPRHDPYDATRLLGERGSALVKLGRGAEARDALESALATMQGQPRIANSLRASLARALAQQGEVEGAVEIAIEAYDGATAMGTKPTLGALGNVRRDLESWAGSPAVRQLDERLSVIG